MIWLRTQIGKIIVMILAARAVVVIFNLRKGVFAESVIHSCRESKVVLFAVDVGCFQPEP